MNFKEIHIGSLIELKAKENAIEMVRICKFFQCSEKEIIDMYAALKTDTENLLKWSKLLKYDFFRIYSQHIILYAPPGKIKSTEQVLEKASRLPIFRKNI